MANDDLDLDQNAAPDTKPEQTHQGLTPEQLQGVMNQTMAPIQRSLTNLGSRLDSLEESRGGAPTPEPTGNDDDAVALAQRFLEDPKSVLDEHGSAAAQAAVEKFTSEQLAPALLPMFETLRDERIEDAAKAFDDQYGDGAFDELVRPRLVGDGTDENPGLLSPHSVANQARPEIIGGSIEAIIGKAFKSPDGLKDLNDRFTKTAKAREAMNHGGMVGAGTPGQRPGRLSQQQRETLDRINENSNIKMDEATLMENMTEGAPQNITEWRERRAAKKASA